MQLTWKLLIELSRSSKSNLRTVSRLNEVFTESVINNLWLWSDSKILAIHVEIDDDKASHYSFKEKIEEVMS